MDTEYLQESLDNLADGDTLMLKAKTYTIDHALTVPAGVSIDGFSVNIQGKED